MDALNEFLCQEGFEKYSNAVDLSEKESQNDPETEPFKSKYKAREIWENLKEKITHLIGDDPGLDGVIAVAVLNYRIGTNFIETEELSSGQNLVLDCVSKLEGQR